MWQQLYSDLRASLEVDSWLMVKNLANDVIVVNLKVELEDSLPWFVLFQRKFSNLSRDLAFRRDAISNWEHVLFLYWWLLLLRWLILSSIYLVKKTLTKILRLTALLVLGYRSDLLLLRLLVLLEYLFGESSLQLVNSVNGFGILIADAHYLGCINYFHVLVHYQIYQLLSLLISYLLVISYLPGLKLAKSLLGLKCLDNLLILFFYPHFIFCESL